MSSFERKNDSLIYKDTDGNRKTAPVVIPVSQNGSPLSLIGLKSLQYDQIAVDNSNVVSVNNIPAGTKMALIKIEQGAIRYRDDGQDPTPGRGMPLDIGESMVYDAVMSDVRMIAMTQTSSLVNVIFYGDDDANN